MDDKLAPNKNSVYPEAKQGPLGAEHASYAKKREFAGKPDHSSQPRIIIFGLLLVAIIGAVVVWLMINAFRTHAN